MLNPGYVCHLGRRSKNKLTGVNLDLVRVVELAIKITRVDFSVIEGLRTRERQAKLLRDGKSKTMRSRHLTGHAVDLMALVDGKASWKPEDYVHIEYAMKTAANHLGVPIKWGGDWRTFKDYVHWQLPWHNYPSAVKQ